LYSRARGAEEEAAAEVEVEVEEEAAAAEEEEEEEEEVEEEEEELADFPLVGFNGLDNSATFASLICNVVSCFCGLSFPCV